MKDMPQAWANYWRNTLADTSWSISIDSPDIKYKNVNLDHLKALALPAEATKQLFHDHEAAQKSGEEAEVIQVAVSPIVLVKDKEHMERKGDLPDKVAPLWIRFDLSADGTLSFNMERYQEAQRDIWLTRHYLSPTPKSGKKDALILGDVDDMDHFIANNVFTGTDWKNTLEPEALARGGLKLVFSSFFDAGISTTLGSASQLAATAVDLVKESFSQRTIDNVTSHYSDQLGETIANKVETAVLPDIKLGKDDRVSFESLLDYGLSMLKHVCPDYPQQMAALGYSFVDNQYGIVGAYPDNSKMTGNIKATYDAIVDLDKDEIPPLFKTYATASKRRPRGTDKAFTCFKNGHDHTGHMSPQHGLSASQREAISHIGQHKYDVGSIIAVNGPPGTGKTTLLQDVVATEWVNAALNSEQALAAVPCVIAASSTNNQAVTNIIESFQRIEGVERWLPDPDDLEKNLAGVGMYLTNSGDAAKKGYHYTKSFKKKDKAGEGLPSKIETPEYIKAATETFLAHYSRACAGTESGITLKKAAEHLHDFLKKKRDALILINAYTSQLHEDFPDIYGHQLKKNLASLEASLKTVNLEQAALDASHDKWLEHVETEPFFMSLFSFLSIFKRKKIARNKRFFKSLSNLPFSYSSESDTKVNKLFDDAINQLKTTEEALKEKIANTMKQIASYDWLSLSLIGLCEEHLGVSDPDEVFNLISELGEFRNDDHLSSRIDTELRYTMFIVTLHFWEARWLIAAAELYKDGKRVNESSSNSKRKQMWRRYAMITPCLVTTMHSGPAFFSYFTNKSHPMFGFIDLLVVDEAGQVSPELAGPMFSLAKRAVVVGDRQQIEPVWPVTSHMDYAALTHYQIHRDLEAAEEHDKTGMHCSSGSVMLIAQNSSPVQKEAKGGYQFERGLFLAEHRRCVDPLVSYFNELAYGGQIIPLRHNPPPESSGLKPWQHLHVEGSDQRVGSSRRNKEEAIAIAQWIKDNQSFLEGYYDKPITDIVGIITPFAVQYKTIEQELKKQGITSSSTTIKGGTVHALQGAERPVVLFSTVYGTPGGNYFFNQGVNMLNVAVSRAKDVFVVVGNRDIMNPMGNKPLDLMAKYF